mgnify:CR=1 FL=1|tara:strand:- start:845 stop:1051 length:207 start_codon:yes stop_codon:yes gene_type:complete
MPEIRLNKGESVDRAMRRLKKKVDSEGIIQEVRKRAFYEKPSVKRRREKKASKYKAKMKSQYEKWCNG